MRAFSLVELSIVLVILGLLTGGILAGQSLIRASELRSIPADFARYQTAVGAFRDKYFALPGDMSNATKFWGAADSAGNSDGLGADCANLTTAATGTETCNGNGNGKIGGPGSCNDQYEMYRAWQHLHNAGLVEGRTTAVRDPDDSSCRWAVVGGNMPRSRIHQAGFQLLYRQNADGFLGVGAEKNRIHFGRSYPLVTPWELENGAISVPEAWNIDSKLDDGLPLTGKLRTSQYSWFGAFCTNATNTAYNLTRAGTQECMLSIELGM